MSLGVLLFIVAILVVVMVHESGHFLVAKAFGFKATKFFVGFGPTIWSTQRGETEYGIKAFPLGGFVKIIGMNPYEEIPEEDRPRAYSNKPRWQRALLLVAGSATHFVLAFLLLLFSVMVIGFPTDRATNEVHAVRTRLNGEVLPAFEAGIRPGDRIVGVGETRTDSWTEIRDFIRAHPGESVSFEVERDEDTRTVIAELGYAVFSNAGDFVSYTPPDEPAPTPKSNQEVFGFFGVEPEVAYETKALPGAIGEAGRYTWQVTKDSLVAIPSIFAPVFNGELFEALTGDEERDPRGAVGLVGAGRLAGQSVQEGEWLNLIGLVVAFTIFIGIMNLLPLPPLDGGHLAVVAYEGITGREVDMRKLIPVAAAVISFFILLFLAVLYLDIERPLDSPF